MDASEAAAVIDRAIPFFFVLMGLEIAASLLLRRRVYRLGDSIADLALGSVSQVAGLWTKIPAVVGFVLIGQHLSIQALAGATSIPHGNPFTGGEIDWGTLGWWALVFVLIDHQYYWAHRSTHQVNLAWATHVAHHSSEEFNLAVALRQSASQTLFTMWFQFPLALVGVSWLHFTVCMGINMLYQFWIHTRLIRRLGPLEWVLNTPSHHRVHHGRDPKYIDKNHAGVFIVWDRLYGTFQAEEEEPHYGVTTPLRSFNPLWSNLHHYAFVWRTFRAARGVRDKLAVLLRRTGWRPDYLGGPLVPLEVPADHTTYEPPVPRVVKAYAALHFLVAVVLTLQVTSAAATGEAWRIVAGAAFVLLSFSNVASLFDRRAWIVHAEMVRLGLMIAAGVASIAPGAPGAPGGAAVGSIIAPGGAGPGGLFLVGLGAVSLVVVVGMRRTFTAPSSRPREPARPAALEAEHGNPGRSAPSCP